ncbi:pentapeptide repeat-containing protein [Lactococcus lactis]|uniref:Pentapeptide repeat-containing protein n=2 Tax=Lactococcus lactis TaxID=1358 RepID=A0AAE4SYP7_9LACT|nr:pentapeptide repeat-containing protein [Lactococcus lactis]MDV2631386.1 pentapeptide repeat-containing protein [Lactococcus lactis]WMD27399.1 pentapeptide repeat-containing protein [Lactococcus lactis subsp. lactis]
MTGYIAALGAVPTVYLWIVKERKKEQELNNKKQELNQVKISELNKVYVDAVNQLSKHETVLAGAYALNGLIDDWIGMVKEYPENRVYYNTRVEQILGIILTLNREELQENAQEQYNTLLVSLVKRLSDKDYTPKVHWENFDFSNLHALLLELPNVNLSGAKLKGSEFIGCNFIDSNLSDTDLRDTNLMGSDFTCSDLSGSNLSGADLTGSNLANANIRCTDLTGADLTGADLTGADLTGSRLTNANLTGTSIEEADFTGTDLTGANLSKDIFPIDIDDDFIIKN